MRRRVLRDDKISEVFARAWLTESRLCGPASRQHSKRATFWRIVAKRLVTAWRTKRIDLSPVREIVLAHFACG